MQQCLWPAGFTGALRIAPTTCSCVCLSHTNVAHQHRGLWCWRQEQRAPSQRHLPHSPHASRLQSSAGRRRGAGRCNAWDESDEEAGVGGGGGPDEEDDDRKLYEAVVSAFTGIALEGTVALAAGWLLHLDAWGHLHWDWDAVQAGFRWVLPLILLDAVLVIPDYSKAQLVTRKLRLPVEELKAKVAAQTGVVLGDAGSSQDYTDLDAPPPPPASATEIVRSAAAGVQMDAVSEEGELLSPKQILAATLRDVASGIAEREEAAAAAAAAAAATSSSSFGSSPDEEFMEQDVQVKQPLSTLAHAISIVQQRWLRDDYSLTLRLPGAALLGGMRALADEMWWRAIVLTGTAAWATDRFYEAGLDDSVTLLGQPTPLALLGVYAAVGLGVALEVSSALYESLVYNDVKQLAEQFFGPAGTGEHTQGTGIRIFKREEDGSEQEVKDVSDELKSELVEAVGVARQTSLFIAAIDAAHESLRWACLAGAFLSTGNLVASLAGASLRDGLVSGYHRAQEWAAGWNRYARMLFCRITLLHLVQDVQRLIQECLRHNRTPELDPIVMRRLHLIIHLGDFGEGGTLRDLVAFSPEIFTSTAVLRDAVGESYSYLTGIAVSGPSYGLDHVLVEFDVTDVFGSWKRAVQQYIEDTDKGSDMADEAHDVARRLWALSEHFWRREPRQDWIDGWLEQLPDGEWDAVEMVCLRSFLVATGLTVNHRAPVIDVDPDN